MEAFYISMSHGIAQYFAPVLEKVILDHMTTVFFWPIWLCVNDESGKHSGTHIVTRIVSVLIPRSFGISYVYTGAIYSCQIKDHQKKLKTISIVSLRMFFCLKTSSRSSQLFQMETFHGKKNSIPAVEYLWYGLRGRLKRSLYLEGLATRKLPVRYLLLDRLSSHTAYVYLRSLLPECIGLSSELRSILRIYKIAFMDQSL